MGCRVDEGLRGHGPFHRFTQHWWRADAAYNQLPILPPAVELESKAILKQCIRARAALAELKQAAELIPNQGMLTNTLPLLEARASSEIENIVTTTDRLFKYRQADDRADPMTKEALRYSYALLEGFRALAKCPLNTGTAEQVCSKIKGVEMRVRQGPGTALANEQSGEIIYIPPVGENLLRNLLTNWEKFLHDAVNSSAEHRVCAPESLGSRAGESKCSWLLARLICDPVFM
jgi:Fic family protein